MLRLACSVALRIASGTSRALPAPWPTRPLPSPTITSAAKPKRRPPLTTLATRLMPTSFSTRSLSSRVRSRRSPRGDLAILPRSLKRQAAGAGGFGQGLHPAMKQRAAAVEPDVLDPRGDRPLGDQPADFGGRGHVRPRLQFALQPFVDAGRGGQSDSTPVVDHLRVNMQARPKDRQARPAPPPPP